MNNIWQEKDGLLEVHARWRNGKTYIIERKKNTIIRSDRQQLIMESQRLHFFNY